MDGELGALLQKELGARGLYCLPRGLMENGFRQISTVERPVKSADDLIGVTMRIPGGRMFSDLFQSLGAVPVHVTIAQPSGAPPSHRAHGPDDHPDRTPHRRSTTGMTQGPP